jgi:hypothetical protein
MNDRQTGRSPAHGGWLARAARQLDSRVLRHPITVGLVVGIGGPAVLAYLHVRP